MRGIETMGEYKNIRDLRLIPIVLTILNLFAIVIFYLKKFSININLLSLIDEVELINIGSFLLLFVGYLIITNLKINASQEVIDYINKKTNYMTYLNIFFLIIVLIFVRDKTVMIALFNIEIYFFAIYILTKQSYASQFRHIKSNYETIFEKDKSNFSWRIRPWFNPYEKVRLSHRLKALKSYDILILIVLTLTSYDFLIFILLIILSFRSILLVLEIVIPLQTSICGTCTSITEMHDSSENVTYYTIHVTDYEKKREVVFEIYNYPYIKSGQRLTVVHGVLSKRVFYVKELNLDIRK